MVLSNGQNIFIVKEIAKMTYGESKQEKAARAYQIVCDFAEEYGALTSYRPTRYDCVSYLVGYCGPLCKYHWEAINKAFKEGVLEA